MDGVSHTGRGEREFNSGTAIFLCNRTYVNMHVPLITYLHKIASRPASQRVVCCPLLQSKRTSLKEDRIVVSLCLFQTTGYYKAHFLAYYSATIV